MVYSTIYMSGGLLGLYWPIKISSEFRSAGIESTSDGELRALESAETHYKWIVVFHFVFWAAVIFLGTAFELPRKPGLSDLVIRIGLVEVLLFFVLLIRLIYVFEKQFIPFGHKPKLWLTIGSTVLWLWSVRRMQQLSNMALAGNGHINRAA